MYVQIPSSSNAKIPPLLPLPDKVIEVIAELGKLLRIPTRASSLPSYGPIPVLVMVVISNPGDHT